MGYSSIRTLLQYQHHSSDSQDSHLQNAFFRWWGHGKGLFAWSCLVIHLELGIFYNGHRLLVRQIVSHRESHDLQVLPKLSTGSLLASQCHFESASYTGCHCQALGTGESDTYSSGYTDAEHSTGTTPTCASFGASAIDTIGSLPFCALSAEEELHKGTSGEHGDAESLDDHVNTHLTMPSQSKQRPYYRNKKERAFDTPPNFASSCEQLDKEAHGKHVKRPRQPCATARCTGGEVMTNPYRLSFDRRFDTD